MLIRLFSLFFYLSTYLLLQIIQQEIQKEVIVVHRLPKEDEITDVIMQPYYQIVS